VTDVKVLTSPYQRGTGAMFTSGLGETVLVFAYPSSFNRVFTTWFCPPLLRILCFDDNGVLSYDRVVRSWRLISLPKTRLVLEVDPDLLCDSIIEDIARLGVDSWIGQYVSSQEFQSVGGTPVEDPYGKLIFALVRSALMELRGVKNFGKNIPQRLKKMPAWRRGQILSTASFIVDIQGTVPYDIPSSALELSTNLLQAALDQDERAEILAAALAGSPCELEAPCFRCGCMANTWRPILKPIMNIPCISSWRLTRPENHVPICQHCAGNLSWETDQDLEIALGYAYWGSRFEALHQWYENAKAGTLPAQWNLDDYPLWPAEYGGLTWALGSGAIQHCAPRLGNVDRDERHLQRMRDIIESRGMRWTESSRKGLLYSCLHDDVI